MLKFEPFSVSALQRVLPYIQNNPSLCSDLSAGYLYMWHEGVDMQLCVWHDTFVIRQNVGGLPAFSYPFGADPAGMTAELIVSAREQHIPLRFFAADPETLDKLRRDGRLQPFTFAYDRRWSDYIYDFSEAMTFRGKKYSGQRNHINKFKKLYGEPVIRFLTEEDTPDVEALLDEYAAEHTNANALERMELRQTRGLYSVCGDLGLFAAGLFTDGRLAALSVGEVKGDMLLIHVEKALTRYEGIYPTMYSGFVRLMAERLGGPLRYVNREDDSGDPGIRTSKQQYHPILMADKNLVHINSPAARRAPGTVLRWDGVVLTEFREQDRAPYLKLNTDVENNRYWGYDYREDVSLTGPVDEALFYDSAMFDMQVGDSINFAVRLSEDGEMIGEAVLWNFTSDGFGELGCRILPEYHGHGYGADAFGAAADYALRSLGVKLWARCYHQNAASARMITKNGFVPLREDDTFTYYVPGGTDDPGRDAYAAALGGD